MIDVHKRLKTVRPASLVIYVPNEKPKTHKLGATQKRYHNAARLIEKIDNWRRIEMYDEADEIVDVINFEDTLEADPELKMQDRDLQLLNLLSENNNRILDRFEGIFGDMVDGYAKLAEVSVERAIGAEKAWIRAIEDLAAASQDGGNGESTPDKIIGQLTQAVQSKFLASGTVETLQKQVDELKAKLRKTGRG